MTTRAHIVAAAICLFACGAQVAPVEDLAGNDMPAPLDLAAADLAPDPCDGWTCETDANCPPTLCATSTGFGTCQSGLCRWR